MPLSPLRRAVSGPGARLLGLLLLLAAGLLAEDFEGDLRIARAYIDSQRYQDAAKALKGVLDKDPEVAEAHFLYGEIYRENDKGPTAKRYYQKTLEVEPTHAKAAEYLMEILQVEARTGGLAVYEQAVRAGIYLPPALLEIMKAYARSRGSGRKMLALADRFIAKLEAGEVPRGFNREGSETLLLAARVAYQGKDLGRTRKLLEQATSQNGSVEGLRELRQEVREELERQATPPMLEGNRLAMKGDFPGALSEYRKALEIHPDWQQVRDNVLAVNNLVEAETLYREAVQLLDAGNVQGALTKLILGLSKSVENQDLALRNQEIMSKISAKKAEIEKAEVERKRASRERQQRFANAYSAGEEAAKKEDWIEAARSFREAVDLFPSDEKAMERLDEAEKQAALQRTFEQGVAAYKKHQYQAALAAFQSVAEKSRSDPELKKYLALTYFYLEKYAQAEPLADQALADSAADKRMLYVMGVIADKKAMGGQGRPEMAISYFEKIESQDSDYLDVKERLSRLRWQRDRTVTLALALGMVFWIAVMGWHKYRPQILKNRLLTRIQKYSAKENWKALAALEDDARNFPLDRTQDLAVNTALAQAFYHTQEWQKAINWCQSALARARENPALVLLMGRIYFEARIISQEVLKFLLALAETEPENVELLRFIGEFCLDKQIVNEDTMPVLRNLAMAMPQHDKLRRLLIRGYVRNNDTSARALALYRAELQKDPDRVDLRFYVAQDTFKSGRTEEAIQHCEKILNVRLNHPETHDLLRECYTKLGKLDELARIYQGILENDPYNPAVQDSLKKILAGAE